MNQRFAFRVATVAIWMMLSAAFSIGQQASKPLTNADVIEMTKKGMSPSAIIALLNSKPTNFDVSYPAMLQLQQNGVDHSVGDLMMRLTVQKSVMANLKNSGTMDQLMSPEGPVRGKGVKLPSNSQGISQMLSMSDDDFKSQQEQGLSTLAEHGCFGPQGPKLKLHGGRLMLCQGVSSNMAPGSSAKVASPSVTTNLKSGFMIGGQHAVIAVPATAQFEYFFGRLPQGDSHVFVPLLVKLKPGTGERVVARTNMKVTVKLPSVRWQTEIHDDVVPAEIVETNPIVDGLCKEGDIGCAVQAPNYIIHPLAPLPPGEYGIVLRRGKDPNMVIEDAKTDPAMGVVQAVWDFRVDP